jgi:PTS system mannose-specific IIB component
MFGRGPGEVEVSISFVRVDDRFIHGQVTTGWARKVGTDRILLVNDDIAKNSLIQKLQRLSAGPDIEVIFLTEDQARERLQGEGLGEGSVFLLVGNPAVLLRLVEAGLHIPEVNLGNLRYEPGKRKVTNWMYVNDVEAAALKELSRRGIRLIAQWIVAEDSVDVNEWLEKHAG